MSARTTHIGADTRLAASIRGTGALTVDGHVDGPVSLEGDLIIGSRGTVVGDVEATGVQLDGQIRGSLKARDAIVGSTARLSGDVTADNIAIDPKAQLDVRFSMPLNLPREVGSRGR